MCVKSKMEKEDLLSSIYVSPLEAIELTNDVCFCWLFSLLDHILKLKLRFSTCTVIMGRDLYTNFKYITLSNHNR